MPKYITLFCWGNLLDMEQSRVDLNELYNWIDEQHFTRRKKFIHRDFADAVNLAEILKYHYPRLVQMHNYSPQNSVQKKLENWRMLNKRVLTRMRINLSEDTMEELANSEPGTIEKVLNMVKKQVETLDHGDVVPPRPRPVQKKVRKLKPIYQEIHARGEVVCGKAKKHGKRIALIRRNEYKQMKQDIKEKQEIKLLLEEEINCLKDLADKKDEAISCLTAKIESTKSPSSKIRHFLSSFFS